MGWSTFQPEQWLHHQRLRLTETHHNLGRTWRPTLPFRLCSRGWPSLSQAVVKRHMPTAAGAGYKPTCGRSGGGWSGGGGCTAAGPGGMKALRHR